MCESEYGDTDGEREGEDVGEGDNPALATVDRFLYKSIDQYVKTSNAIQL